MVDSIAEKGNLKAKAKWEANVPPCWVPPSPNSRYVCKEQWIMAKYDREQFLATSGASTRPYMTGVKQGILYKRMKQSDVWNGRWFVLADRELSYFKSYNDRTAKTVIPLLHMNAVLNGPGLESHPNSMLIAFWDEKCKKHRHIFVYAEVGRDIMDWFCAIRSAKIVLMREMIPELTVEEAAQKATWDFSIWGYLCKTPPTQKKFQKRFFVLDKNTLRYYQTPYDPFPLGEILLGPSVRGYWVDEEVPEKLQHYTNVFMLHTPVRSKGGFPLLAEDSASKMAWISALQASVRNFKRLSPSRDVACASAQRREQRLGYEEEDNITSSKVTTVL
jgi:hypothetical protein